MVAGVVASRLNFIVIHASALYKYPHLLPGRECMSEPVSGLPSWRAWPASRRVESKYGSTIAGLKQFNACPVDESYRLTGRGSKARIFREQTA